MEIPQNRVEIGNAVWRARDAINSPKTKPWKVVRSRGKLCKVDKWGQTLFFKHCFSASTALSSFYTSTFAALPLEGSKIWKIMQFSSQSESVERSAMDAGTPLKNGVLKNRVWPSLKSGKSRQVKEVSPGKGVHGQGCLQDLTSSSFNIVKC